MLQLVGTNRSSREVVLLRAVRVVCEELERRTLLTSNLFLDFGDNFPVGGLQMTVLQLRNNFGAATPGLQGPDLRQADDPTTTINEALVDGDLLNFARTQPLVTFDYNQDGATNVTDYTDLRAAVLSLVQRYYASFDVNVQIAPAVNNATSADYINGVRAQLQAGANVDGERDSWVFISNVTRAADGVSIGLITGNFGVSNGTDIGGNNANDNTQLAYVDRIFNSANLTGSDADTRLAYTAAHEAGHDFGLQHTNNGRDNNGNSASGNAQTDADMLLQTSSNLVTDSAPAIVRQNFVFVTRFPLVRGDNNVGAMFNINDTVNHYNILANNNNLGLRAGAPAYITGTGAFDLITLSSGGGSTVNVSLQTHRNANFNSQIGATQNFSVDSSNGILIEMGLNADRLVLNANINASITLRGMNGNDQLVVLGNSAASGSFTPASASSRGLDDQTYFGGTLTAGGTTVQLEEFLIGGAITVQDITSFSYTTPNSNDVLTLASPAAGQMRVTGTSAGTQLLPLSFFNVQNFTLDTGANDAGSPSDTVLVQGSASAGLQTLSINTGGGDDTLTVNFSTGNPVPSGGLSYDGGIGTNDLLVLQGGSFTNETYTATGFTTGNINLDGSVISFSNLAPILDSVPATNFSFVAPASDDIINVSHTGASTRIASGNSTFELIDLSNKGSIAISGAAGNDTINLTASAFVPISVNGGTQTTIDRLNFDGEGLDFAFSGSSFANATRQTVTYAAIETIGLSNGFFSSTGTIAPNVVVDNGATLGGTAEILGAMNALTGGTVAPGDTTSSTAATGLLTVGGASFVAGSTYRVDLNGLTPGTQHDQLIVKGTLSLGGATLAANLGFTPLPGEDLVIIRNDLADPVAGTFAEGSLATFGGLKFAIDYAFEADADLNLNDVAMIRFGAALGPDPCHPGNQALFVSATTGNDVIRFVPATGNSRIEVLINGASEGIFTPSIHGLLIGYGQSGHDTISVEVPSRHVILYGNVGNDTLNTGNNNGILFGNLGNDRLNGGNQKDILIGGRGADHLSGGNADDILIAGFTPLYEANTAAARAALCSILDEFEHGSGGYAGRVGHIISGGGRNGANVLNATNVFDDNDLDVLAGGSGRDWFMANVVGAAVLDQILDLAGGEIVTDLL